MLRTNMTLALTFAAVAAIAPAVVNAQAAAANSSSGSVASADNTAEISARSALIVSTFSVNAKTGWPYDPKQLQSQTVAELKAKSEAHFDVSVGPPATPRARTYKLEGEIVSWRPGSRAKRMLVGMGSGRESADIRYWLTDENGKKVFEHKDTIRAEFWGNAYESSVGQLAHPFASKISARLSEAKLF